MAQKSAITKSEMPPAESNGFVRTLNGMGFMTSTLDDYSREFATFAPTAPGPALDIGVAYGVASLAALLNGAIVIANDVESRHLDILFNRTPLELRGHLRLMPGRFPQGVEIEENSIGAVLVSRVFHFFDGPSIELSVRVLYSWLQSGGKAFVTGESPYLRNFQAFIPEYERKKSLGALWPGFVEDVMKMAPDRGRSLPKAMNLLDPETLTRVFVQAGFCVEKVGFFARPEFPEDIRLDGRESVGIIAVKP